MILYSSNTFNFRPFPILTLCDIGIFLFWHFTFPENAWVWKMKYYSLGEWSIPALCASYSSLNKAYPTDSFTISELQNLSFHVSGSHNFSRSTDFEALKWWTGRSGNWRHRPVTHFSCPLLQWWNKRFERRMLLAWRLFRFDGMLSQKYDEA